MKRLLAIAFLALFSACSCSTRAEFQAVPLPGIPLEVDPSVQIIAPTGGAGHGCPVNDILVTNAHVMKTDSGAPVPFVSISHRERQGVAALVSFSLAYDLALLDTNLPLTYLPAGDMAAPGDTVYWFEYDFRTLENILRPRRRVGKILRVVAGHYVLDSSPVGGASGTCLINVNGEVIGLINAAFDTEDGKAYAGLAVVIPKDLSR